jgi:hypothetical protein
MIALNLITAQFPPIRPPRFSQRLHINCDEKTGGSSSENGGALKLKPEGAGLPISASL